MKFRTMKTAPKDGTEILLQSKEGIRSGRYSPWGDDDEDPWKYRRYSSDGCGCCGTPNHQPTGWLPLPVARNAEVKPS